VWTKAGNGAVPPKPGPGGQLQPPDLAAPAGDYFSATGTVQDAILAAMPASSSIYSSLDPLSNAARTRGITTAAGSATYARINGTSMAAPHVTGVAALVIQLHPNWPPSAVAATLTRTATPMSCPPDWEPLGPNDERFRCTGGGGHTSFFGAGLVDAAAATS
jgi:subtilisin family serine protease